MIQQLRVKDFRSIKDETVDELTSLFAIAGRNGTGKSNILRALNLFFNGEVESGVGIDLSRDFHRGAERKDRKVIRIEVSFELPVPPFHWRRGVIEHATDLGFDAGAFTLAREWYLDPDTRRVADRFEFLRDGQTWTQVGQDHQDFIQLLLTRLIRYRYVPNHIHPVSLIENERSQLQRTLMARLNRSRRLGEELDLQAPLQAMAEAAAEVIEPVISHLTETAPEIEEARIATPDSWADIALSLDLELQEQGQSSRSALMHGSGHQSVVALSMLYLIDTDFATEFGWHQATIWGIEEPEAYLHHELAYNVGQLLARFGTHERFQILVTTHSPTIVAFADAGVLTGEAAFATCSSRDLISAAATSGVGPFVHPLLVSESKPLLVVEGSTDRMHFENAYRILRRPCPWSIAATDDLDLPGGSRGFGHLIRQHGRPLAARNPASPVIAVLDHHENLGDLNHSFRQLHPTSSAHRWDVNQANPDLNTTEFRGIEAYLDTEALEAADQAGLIHLLRPAARTPISCREMNKAAIARLCAERDNPDDYRFFEPMMNYLESQLTSAPMLMP